MATRDVPPSWAGLLEQAKLVDSRNGAPSMSRLAEASGVHASTISAMMYGDRQTKAESVDKVAAAIAAGMRADRREGVRAVVHELVGRALRVQKPFEPHPDADLLTGSERKAINELIRVMTIAKKQGAVRLDVIRGGPDLSVETDTSSGAIAADEQETSIAGEQEESETP